MLDHLGTLRHIWPGHLSNAHPSVWNGEVGMVRVHEWLRTLVPWALPAADNFALGDKPDDSSVRPTAAAKVMPRMPGKECLRQTFERVFKGN